MKALYIDGTDDTPEVILDKEQCKFELSGKSLPEDVISFYEQVNLWLEEYVKSPNDTTKVKVNIIYFNSASQRALNDLLLLFKSAESKGSEVKVEWHYDEDDDEMREAGEEFAEITGLSFSYLSYQN